MMMDTKERCIKLANDIKETKKEDGSTTWSCPHEIWPWVDQLRIHGVAMSTACWLLRNWLSAGWAPPSVIADIQLNEFKELKEEMASLKQNMNQIQEWYSKLDEFLKAKANNEIQVKKPD